MTLSSLEGTFETEDQPPLEPNSLIAGDARTQLKRIPDESVQLTVTSPPYNIGKDYSAGYDDDGPIAEWRQMVVDVFDELFRLTKPDGKVVVNIGKSFADSDEHGRFEFFPLTAYVKQIALDVGFDFWDEIIWNKQGFQSRGGGALMGSYPYPTNLMVTQTHEHILVFRKYVSDSYHSNREIPSKGTARREGSALTKERWRELTQSVWEFNGVRQSSLDVDHTAVFPEEIPKRAIQLYSFVGDTVLDPFIGTGTTAVAAKRADRDYIGIDIGEDYIEHAMQRVDSAVRDEGGYVVERE
jgi:DNA modification methylase